jgi:hypothetical protein
VRPATAVNLVSCAHRPLAVLMACDRAQCTEPFSANALPHSPSPTAKQQLAKVTPSAFATPVRDFYALSSLPAKLPIRFVSRPAPVQPHILSPSHSFWLPASRAPSQTKPLELASNPNDLEVQGHSTPYTP